MPAFVSREIRAHPAAPPNSSVRPCSVRYTAMQSGKGMPSIRRVTYSCRRPRARRYEVISPAPKSAAQIAGKNIFSTLRLSRMLPAARMKVSSFTVSAYPSRAGFDCGMISRNPTASISFLNPLSSRGFFTRKVPELTKNGMS